MFRPRGQADPALEVCLDDLEAEGGQVAKEVAEGPADWFFVGEGVTLDVEPDAEEDDEEDAKVDVACVESLSDGGLGLGE